MRTYGIGGRLIHLLGGMAMSDYEILSLVVEFATLIVIILTLENKK